jgi:hypothetical protein
MNIYPNGKQGLLDGTVAWLTDDIRVALVDSTWVYNTAHKFVADGVTGGIIARSAAGLAGKAININGANVELVANDVTIAAVPTGHTIAGVVLYSEEAATDATRRLIAFVDKQQDGTTAISLATNGSDVLVDLINTGLLEF